MKYDIKVYQKSINIFCFFEIYNSFILAQILKRRFDIAQMYFCQKQQKLFFSPLLVLLQ